SRAPLRLLVRDDVPPAFDVDRRVHEARIAPAGTATVEYLARPRHRGTFRFGDVHVRARSVLDLVERQWPVPLGREARVYPNLLAIAKGDEVGLLAYADGIAGYLPPRRGKGQFRRITEELQRLEPLLTEPDHRAAFAFLRSRSARRALVVLFTDLIDEDASRGL